jgi:hypothetical protein
MVTRKSSQAEHSSLKSGQQVRAEYIDKLSQAREHVMSASKILAFELEAIKASQFQEELKSLKNIYVEIQCKIFSAELEG